MCIRWQLVSVTVRLYVALKAKNYQLREYFVIRPRVCDVSVLVSMYVMYCMYVCVCVCVCTCVCVCVCVECLGVLLELWILGVCLLPLSGKGFLLHRRSWTSSSVTCTYDICIYNLRGTQNKNKVHPGRSQERFLNISQSFDLCRRVQAHGHNTTHTHTVPVTETCRFLES